MPRYRVPFLAGAGVQTDDGRTFTEVTWRTLPLPLAFQDDTQHAALPSSSIVGQIVELDRAADGTIVAVIEVDPRDDNGRAIHEDGERAASMIEQGGQGISIDGLVPIDATIDEECVQEDETEIDGETVTWCTQWAVTFSEVVVAGATLTPIPAYSQAIVDPAPIDVMSEPMGLALVASAAVAPVPALVAHAGFTLTAGAAVELSGWALNAEHFARPELSAEANYINVDADGRCWGWIAPAERCHQGIPGECVLAAHESPDLSDFLRNHLPIGDAKVPVGFLTMDMGHADVNLDARSASAVYDDTRNIAAIVTAGIVPRGEHSAGSVWFSGSVSPRLDDWQRTVLAAGQASGDWRADHGSRTRTLRAALVVPVPGFLRKRDPVLAGGAVLVFDHEAGEVTTTTVATTTNVLQASGHGACSCGGHGSAPAPEPLTAAHAEALRRVAEDRIDADLASLDAQMSAEAERVLEALDADMAQ